MVNEHYEPTSKEEDVIDVMQEEWRANPYLIRDQTGHGKGDVNTALSNLTSAGWVRKITRGLYEFVEDPRTEVDTSVRERLEPEQPTDTSVRKEESASPELEPLPSADADTRSLVVEHVDWSVETVERTSERIDLVADLYDRLQEKGEIKKSEIVTEFDHRPCGLSESSWYERLVSPMLRQVPGAKPPKRGASTWTYTGQTNE